MTDKFAPTSIPTAELSDAVPKAVEAHQLPAPDFRVGEVRTTAILFSHKVFEQLDRNERVRAAYQPARQDKNCWANHIGRGASVDRGATLTLPRLTSTV